jgi:hypothetical protein
MTALAQRIVRAMGGDWYGPYGMVPAPGHSPKDRSISIRPHSSDPGDVVVNSFSGDDPLAIKDELRSRGLLPERSSPSRMQVPRKPAQEALGAASEAGEALGQLKKAHWLWGCSQPVPGTLAERYLREVRRIEGELLPTRFLPASGEHPPTMVAAFGLTDEPEPGFMRVEASALRGVHLTKLRPDGLRKAAKIMLGRGHTLPIVLGLMNDGLELAITEGVEDGLTVRMLGGFGVWAAGSANRMPGLAAHIPSWVARVTVFIDADPAGERFGNALVGLLKTRGLEVIAVRMAEANHGD